MGRHVVTWLVLGLVGCGGVTPSSITPTRPTPLVSIRGENAHALGRELSRSSDGEVEVQLHAGTRLWVDAERIGRVALDPGDHVVVRWNDTASLYTAVVLERMDELIRVRFDSDETAAIVSLTDVLSLLDEPAAARPPDQADAEPAVDLERQAAFGPLDAWAPSFVAECGEEATVLLPGGERRAIPLSDVSIRPLAVGETVMARYQDGPLSYVATVTAIDGADISLRYGDGTEESLTLEQITMVLREPTEDDRLTVPHPACRRAGRREPPAVLARVGRYHRIGEVRSCTGDTAEVVDRRGDVRRLARASLRRPTVRVGDRVRVRYGTEWYLAAVTASSPTSIRVTYEDGSPGDVTLADVDLLGPDLPAAEPPACP